MIKIEKRAYGSDSSEAEIEMLRSRVTLLDDDIICYQEVYVLSEFQIEIMAQKANELIVKDQDNYMLLNLSLPHQPNSTQRKKIRECFSEFSAFINYASIYTGGNILNNIAAKFVLSSIGFPVNSVHSTREQSLKAIKKAKKERAQK